MATETTTGFRDIVDPTQARWRSQRLLLGCAAPFLLAPLLALGTQASKCLYAVMVVCSLWLSQLIPLQAASLLPLLLISAVGIAPTSDVARAYYDDNVLCLICCCVLACCFEESHLPRRIVLLLLHLRLGYKAMTLLLVFALSTAVVTVIARRTFAVIFLSLLVRAITREMRCTAKLRCAAAARSLQPTTAAITTAADEPKGATEVIDEDVAEVKRELREYQQLQNALLMVVALSCHLGSSTFFTGSQIHLRFLDLFSRTLEPGILTSGAWVAVNAPPAIILILLVCFLTRIVYLRKLGVYSLESKDHRKEMNFIFSSQYSDLEPVTAWEALVAFFVVFFVVIQFTREPVFFHGWAAFLNVEGFVSDATSSALVLLVMGFVPVRLMELTSRHRLLNWRVVLPDLPWGMALVVGAGNAFAYAANKTGFIDTTISWLDRIKRKPVLTQVGLSFSSAFSAQFTRQFLDTSRLHQIVEKSVQDNVHPMMYVLPAASAASFSYVMPTASVANIMVYRYGDVAPVHMLISSVLMLVCSCLLTVGSYHVLERSLWSHVLSRWENSTHT